ncbi:MAG: DedA family protein [Pseudomonadota bacterium]
MAEWIATYGYPLLFLGTIIEGETFLLIAAVMARQGALEIVPVMAVALAGALSGDSLFFVIGKTRGAAFLDKRPHWQRRTRRLSALMNRFHVPLMLGFRFWYGMRAVIPLTFGMNRFGSGTFILLNTVGALLWVAIIGGVGFWLGDAARPLVDGAQKKLHWVLLSVIAGVAVCRRIAALKHRQPRANPALTCRPKREHLPQSASREREIS